MDYITYIKFLVALVFVLGLIGLATWATRKLGLVARVTRPRGQGRRLTIVEVAVVDAKRRLVLVRRDDTEHLLLLGGGADVVVESQIRATRATIAQAPERIKEANG